MSEVEQPPSTNTALPSPASPPPLRGGLFYAIDRRAVFCKEWSANKWQAAAAWVLAKLGAKFPVSLDDPLVDRLEPFEISEQAVPENTRQACAETEKSLIRLGFHSPVYHSFDDHLHTTGIFTASYAHGSLPIVARLRLRVWSYRTPPVVRFYPEYLSARADGTFLRTVPVYPEFLSTPSCRVVQGESGSPDALLERHRREFGQGAAALPARDPSEVRDICERLHAAQCSWLLSRGVYRPLLESEQRVMDATRQAMAATSPHATVLAHIARLEARTANWVTTLLVLVVSLGLFIFIGVRGVSLLLLVPVLLFHELGHYIAMRVFGYRDVRMFFIPGFGAAVSGRNYSAPAWKKVAVALMGPVPGIIVGGLLGMAGVVMSWKWASDVGLFMLILNGFNLLPMLPLDGGQVARDVIFCRHPVLDVVFRVLAAGSMALAGILLNTYVLIGVAVVLFMSLPQVLRIGRVAQGLRREGVGPPPEVATSIPPALAERIIDRLQQSQTKPRTNALIAQETLAVFESLNSRPPGWLASTGIIAVHAGCLLGALVLTVMITVGTGMKDRSRLGPNPKHSLSVSAIHATADTPPAGEAVTIAATWPSERAAKSAEGELTPRLKSGESLTALGSSLLIRSPASDAQARERWVTELEQRTKDVFVQAGSTNLSFRIRAIAPSAEAAGRIKETLSDYFELPVREGLVSPWASAGVSPGVQRARRTYRLIEHGNEYDHPEMRALHDRFQRAMRLGDQATMDAIEKERNELYTTLHRRYVQEMIDHPTPEQDVELLRAYLELHDRLGDELYPTGIQQLSPRLGLARDPASPGSPPADRTFATAGYVDRVGLTISLSYVAFDDPSQGAPALLRWLQGQGCKYFKYEISTAMEYDDE